MSFADIINQEQKKLEAAGQREGVKYPQTKHKRLFFDKEHRSLLIQVLPSSDLVSAFAEPVRRIFLTARSSSGKDIRANFTLDPEPNEGSLLEQKIAEWADKGMIPNGFGGQQTPRRLYLVNVVRILQNPQNPQQWVQERDQEGNLVVRVFEMPHSAYANLIRKLQNPLFNTSGTELSFMDPNNPRPIEVSKPAKGQMEYPVEVYTNIPLPPLGQGWESQLEDLKALAVPTERLENGYDWVKAFVDMKEGRKPSGSNGNGGETETAPQVNPYAQQQPNPYASTQTNPYAQQQPNPYAQQPNLNPSTNPFAAAPQTETPYVAPQAPTVPQQPQEPVAPQQPVQPQPTQPVNTFETPAVPQQPQQPESYGNIGEEVDLANIEDLMPTGMQQAQPEAPQQNIPNSVPTQPNNAAPNVPTHNVETNDNGLLDIDAMLERELNGGM
ncbi:hypothetical protein LIP24_09880 [Collinsella aerofaciens]|uniref:hypothetical protein n=1 Tax=Collinsella aerofaciens TaxID=74426 RepID=UPI001D01E18E|nr:hypothetical protein [Collinsella aerofaciens]MCB5366946.1 hypothetical protein [Collinsella aerofaciens]